MLSVEDWAEIRRLRGSEGLPIKAIARVLGVSRNTVRAALDSDRPPKYQRAPKGSIVDAVEPQIRELLKVYPTMPATVIAERIGWTHSVRVLSGRVAQLRPVYLPPDPASRTAYAVGEIAQCDFWFPPITLPVGCGQVRDPKRLPVLTMVIGYSRWLSAILIPTRHAEDLFAGWWTLIDRRMSGVPRDFGREGRDLPTRRSGSQGRDRTRPRLSGTVLSSRPNLQRPSRFQYPARPMAGRREHSDAASAGLRAV